MNIIIRKTEEGDFSAIRSILRQVGLAGEWFTEQLFRSMLEKNRGHYFVAIRDSIVIGTVFSSHDGGYFGYIYKLAVLPQCQKEGIGSALLYRVVVEFQSLGIDWYFAHVDKDNHASLKLLAKHGIKPQVNFLMLDSWENATKT